MQKIFRISQLLCVAALVFITLCPSPCLAYSGGTGTPEDPYLIQTPEEMNSIGFDWYNRDKCFKLMADLDMSAYAPYTDEQGTMVNRLNRIYIFSGTFDGNGHVIRNLTYVTTENSTIGLFGFMSGTIKNLGLENVNISSVKETGALVGYNDSGSIINCFCTGSVSGSGDYIGGLVGINYLGTITDSYSNVSVIGGSYIGGLVGDNDGTITDCYNKGPVSGTGDFIGGLVGLNYQAAVRSCYNAGIVNGQNCTGGLAGINYKSVVENCYSTGAAHGANEVGCLIGYNNSTITYCYSTGPVTGILNIGGMVGNNQNGTIDNSFWDTETSGLTTSAGGTGKTTVEMKTLSTFTSAGWDFTDEMTNGTNDYWKIRMDATEYPLLSWQNFSGGNGTALNPYQIASKEDLLTLASDTGNYDKYFIMTADIDLEGQTFTTAIIAPDTIDDSEHNFDGIAFTGTFDGNGHKIRNLTIDSLSYSYIGLFGQINPGSYLKNIGIINCSFSGGCYVGTLAGANNGGVIMQCYSAGTVQGAEGIGGLVGQNTGEIARCYSSGNTHGSYQVGGLVGCNTGAVGNCYSICNVSGMPTGTLTQITGNEYKYGAGGLVGYNKGGFIEKSYSIGSVSGGYIGGLVGSSGYYEESIQWWCDWICDDQGNCWEDCIPLPTSTFINSEDWVQNSFWDIDSSGCSSSAGGAPMGNDINQFLSAGWDFAGEILNGTDDIWVMFAGQHPRFAWQCPIAGDITLPYGVEISDLLILAEHWLQDGCPAGCDGADLTGNGMVDLLDFAVLSEHWQETTLLGTTAAVPDVSGLTYENAAAILIATGLTTGTYSTAYSESVAEGCVISQTPAAGSIVYPNTSIDLVISQGSNVVYVPDVVGMNQSDAIMLLQTIQLMATVTYSYSDTVEAGYVISQNPVAGTKTYFDSTVDLEVSLGLAVATVPDVAAMSLGDAQSAISNAPILNLTITYIYNDSVAQGYVISQNPAAGTIVSQNSTMNIVVSLGKAYSGGVGTLEDPYRISTSEDLKSVRDNASSHFILISDIDMTGIPWNHSNCVVGFKGTFDGNGHKICNLTYTDSACSIFSSTNSATIKNLTLENLVISFNGPNVQYLGGLAGYMATGTISNCHVTGTISGTGSNNDCIGGLVGYMAGGTISHCSFAGIVSETGTGSELIGGLVGQINDNGTIEYCTSTAQVRGERYIGGIAGYLRFHCNIQNCSSWGSVISNREDCGGLAGYQYDNCTIHHCTSACSVSGTKNLGGLVGFQSYSSVYNCSSTGNVTGSDSLGGLVGYLYYGDISDSWSTGNVTGGDFLGGLLGTQDPVSTIYNCSSTGNVSGRKYLGGLIGKQYSQGIVKNSCSTGRVTGNDYLGGLIGYQSDCRISNCYSTSSINGSEVCVYLGGLVGYQNYSSVSNCYSAGTVTGGSADSHIGGLIGYGSGITSNSFWDITTSGQAFSGGGKGQTIEKMKQAVTYLGWNSDEILWVLDENNDTPHLIWEATAGTVLPSHTLSEFVPGAGTKNDPYRITTAQQLNMIGRFPAAWSKVFSLDADIDLSGITGVEFNIIGASYNGFRGIFEGNNHTINNLTYQTTGYDCYVGLFGYLYSATIRDLVLENMTIYTKGSFVGGLAGLQYSSSTINNCHMSGSVSGDDYVGGLAGQQSEGIINNCTSRCSVIGDAFIGGLVGYLKSYINNSYSAGDVTGGPGSNSVGGLVGEQYYGYNTNIYCCYSTGSVSGDSSVGGLIGKGSQGNATNSFWDTQTSGQTISAAGIGKTTLEMQTLSTFTSNGWDFTNETTNGTSDIWRMCVDGMDYPHLNWESIEGDFACPDGVDSEDLDYFIQQWLVNNCTSSNNYCGGADINTSGVVDLQDMALFAAHWLESI